MGPGHCTDYTSPFLHTFQKGPFIHSTSDPSINPYIQPSIHRIGSRCVFRTYLLSVSSGY